MIFKPRMTRKINGLDVEIQHLSRASFVATAVIIEIIVTIQILSPLLFIVLYRLFDINNTNILLTGIIFSLLISGITIYAGYINSNWIRLTKYTLKDKKITEPLKIIFLADIGAGNFLYNRRAKDIQKMVNIINKEKPDIVLIGGDIIDALESDMQQLLPLKNIHTNHPIFGVLGNHDYLHMNYNVFDAETPWKFIKYLKTLGITILGNEGREITVKGNKLYVGGIWDIENLKFDHKAALNDRKQDAYTILLSHNPDIVDWITAKDNVDLVLSGHLHKGQIYLPIIGPIITAPSRNSKKLPYGLFHLNKCKIIVTSGAGQSGTRVRLGSFPEIVEIKLLPEE